jgi:hypothetical protein
VAALNRRACFCRRGVTHPLAAFVGRADVAAAILAMRAARHRAGLEFQPGAVDPGNRQQNDGGREANTSGTSHSFDSTRDHPVPTNRTGGCRTDRDARVRGTSQLRAAAGLLQGQAKRPESPLPFARVDNGNCEEAQPAQS